MASNTAAAAPGEQSYTNGRGHLGDTGHQGHLGDTAGRGGYTDNRGGYADNMNNAGPGNTAGGGMVSKPHQSMVSQVYDPKVGRIANPGPLGLISFALTTFVLGLYQCGAGLPNSNPFGSVGPDQAVFGLAVFFGGAAQFVAGVMEFSVGNTFGTTVHCSYGAFWLAFAMFLVPSLGIKDAYAGDLHAFTFAVGIFLIMWCFLTLIFFIAALRTNIAILTVLGLLTLAFFFLSIAQFIATSHATAAVRVNRAGGVFAVLCAFSAFYAGSAGIMQKSTTWVTFPLGEFSTEPRHARNKEAANQV